MTVENYWRKVIFSDETQVVLGKDRKVYIWRKDKGGFRDVLENTVIPTHKCKPVLCFGDVSLMMV